MVGKRSLNRPEEPKLPSWRDDPREYGHRHGAHDDLETGRLLPHANGTTPTPPRVFQFRDAAMTALSDLRRDELQKELLSGLDRHELERFRKSKPDLKQIKNKKVRKFYEAQNEKLNDWLEVDAVVTALTQEVLSSLNPDPDLDGDREREGGIQRVAGEIGELLPDEERESRRKSARQARIAVNVNVVANILLLVGKAFAVFTTGSLSLLASLVDSALDLLCTLIVWSTNRVVLWRLNALRKRFPVGKRRLEPLGILVFSIIMVISFMQILQESVQRLMSGSRQVEHLSPAAIASLVATIVIKGIIGLCCYPIKTSQVQALVKDCETDCLFNSFSLLFPFVGQWLGIWWVDPLGAGLLSLYIIYDWGHMSFENVVRLSGEAADERTTRKLTYLAWRFSPVLEGIKNIVAYHGGDGIIAEFDVLLDGKTRLYRSHDIAECMQYCAEGLKEVDRAFVSTDYAAAGPTGHSLDSEWNH
ncbi:Metal tolerance protein 3 [Paramyrothecium foliicola]|nr:Metal tolerance protein 3 [Paramyrothecium foliicola]